MQNDVKQVDREGKRPSIGCSLHNLPDGRPYEVDGRDTHYGPEILNRAANHAYERGGGTHPLSDYDIQHARQEMTGERDIVAAKDAEIAALQARIDDCAPYLKQGQTPVERMQQDQADILSLMKSLERKKERAAMWPRHLFNLIERAREYVQDSLESHEHSDGRDLLNEIDEALTQDAEYCFIKTAQTSGQTTPALQADNERLRRLLVEARWYVQDSLEAHEHSDGRDILNAIDTELRQALGDTHE